MTRESSSRPVRPHSLGWVAVTALVAMVAVAAALLFLKHIGAQSVAAQRDLALVSEGVAKQEALEWRAAAGLEAGEVRDDLVAERAETSALLATPTLTDSHLRVQPHLSKLRDLSAAYAKAVDRELDLLATGDRAAALAFDRETVDPAFERVDNEIDSATAALASQERLARRLSDGGVVLVVLLSGALVVATDRRRRTAERRQRATAEHLAMHDPLTSLPNRRLFLDRLTTTLRRHELSGGGSACLLYLDLDDFKAVNDSFGHAGGDELLVAATRRLQGGVYPTDTLCRLGGDEFAVLLENADAEAGRRTAERLLALLVKDFDIAGHRVRISASVGVAVVDGSWPVASDVLHAADHAMYGAKREGKGRVVVHAQNMSMAALRHAERRQALHAGLAADPADQPIVDLRDGRPTAAPAPAGLR